MYEFDTDSIAEENLPYNPSDETDMTREEAVGACRQIREKSQQTRALLLNVHARKGYLALGYRNFEQFGRFEFHMGRNYLHKLLAAAKIEAELLDKQVDGLCTIVHTGLISIPEGHIRELKRLSTVELRREAYQQGREIAAVKVYPSPDGRISPHSGKLTASILRSVVSAILKREQSDPSEETFNTLMETETEAEGSPGVGTAHLYSFVGSSLTEGDILLIEGDSDGRRAAIPLRLPAKVVHNGRTKTVSLFD